MVYKNKAVTVVLTEKSGVERGQDVYESVTDLERKRDDPRPHDLENGLGIGGCLAKPITNEELVEILKSITPEESPFNQEN